MNEAEIDAIEKFVLRLTEGGTIVSSNDCSVAEIVMARACDRLFVDKHGFGYIYRPVTQRNSANE